MAMLTARFHDEAAAQQAVRTLIDGLGAVPDLVVATAETPLPGHSTDYGTPPDAETRMPTEAAFRVAIYDTAIGNEAGREALERCGGVDIRPIN